MAETSPTPRIAVIGWGAIGQRVQSALHARLLPGAELAVLVRADAILPMAPVGAINFCRDLATLLAWQPDLAIECAGHEAVARCAPPLLRQGTDVMIASVGALGDAALRNEIECAAREGGARPIVVSGAIGGLDALRAAAMAGLDTVRYTGRKPPQAWAGSAAAMRFDLDGLEAPTVIFEGSAAEAARAYPKNANVTAAVALAGIGFERTTVTLLADPGVRANVHEVDARGAFGALSLRLENAPLPDNPKTSWLAALSIEVALRQYLHPASLS